VIFLHGMKNTYIKSLPHLLLSLSVRGTEVFFFRRDLRAVINVKAFIAFIARGNLMIIMYMYFLLRDSISHFSRAIFQYNKKCIMLKKERCFCFQYKGRIRLI
jgi:hypothetical protein